MIFNKGSTLKGTGFCGRLASPLKFGFEGMGRGGQNQGKADPTGFINL
jgi:hypothetical protein